MIVIIIKGSHFTVDNASNNTTFIEEIETIHQVKHNVTWDANEARISCFPHTLNLCTQRTIHALEKLPLGAASYDQGDKDSDNSNEDSKFSDENSDDNDRLNRKLPTSAISKVRALVRGIRASDQRQTAFNDIILAGNTYGWWKADSDTPGQPGKIMQITPKQLILDVRTRWSSTYLMLRRALELRDVCVIF